MGVQAEAVGSDSDVDNAESDGRVGGDAEPGPCGAQEFEQSYVREWLVPSGESLAWVAYESSNG
jgi:hypothetical protein